MRKSELRGKDRTPEKLKHNKLREAETSCLGMEMIGRSK
jgi:hypothetical protein